MEKYSFADRRLNVHWNILQMKVLIENAKMQNGSSFVSYAALEGRIAIERIEFSILLGAANQSNLELSKWLNIISQYQGIQKVNNQLNALKYKYQTFTEAFAKAVVGMNIKYFDFKKAEELKNNLSQYIHIYAKKEDDFIFKSDFIQDGIKLIESVISFINMYNNPTEKGYTYAILDFNSLKNGMDLEFYDWLKSKNDNVEILTERLREIVNNSE
ncbi:MAG: hypothetical protein PHO94_13655 [Petrimonas sp.]|nr:hypothetical protein [Petrimonas sp.]